MKHFVSLTAGLLLAGTAAFGQVTPESLVSDYQAQGYTRIEVRTGPQQIKVEAIRGLRKTETVYDRVTGAVLESETEAVDGDDNTRPGVSVRERARDFVDGRDDDDDDRRSGRGWDDDDDGDDRRSGRGWDDDDDGDDRRSGRGWDDDDDDDDRRSGRGRDDDDRRGRGRGSDD